MKAEPAPDTRKMLTPGPDWIMAQCLHCGSFDCRLFVKQAPSGYVIVAAQCSKCDGASPVVGGCLGVMAS